MLDNLLAGQPEIFSWLFIGMGGLLTLLGVVKIIGKGISLLVWMLMVLAGVSAIHMGLRHQNAIQLSPEFQARMNSMIEPGKVFSQDALRSLCEQLARESNSLDSAKPATVTAPVPR
ncbi:MAG: hypothetical protein HQL82_05835 [Magnetococcales bacterium]|nr:hypothetical protein [Magnetococcales bacterium]